MADEENNEVTLEGVQEQLATATQALETANAERDAMKHKMDELLTEAKKAKEKQRQTEKQAREEAERKAKESQDYEQLYKSSEERHQAAVQELEDLKSQYAGKEINTASLKLATQLAEGHNVELLSEFISKRLVFRDGGVKVTDTKGDLTVASLDDLAKEVQGDPRFSALLRGNQSSGGGAAGGSNGGGAAKNITRADFEALNAADRMKFTRSGGTITD